MIALWQERKLRKSGNLPWRFGTITWPHHGGSVREAQLRIALLRVSTLSSAPYPPPGGLLAEGPVAYVKSVLVIRKILDKKAFSKAFF